MNKLLKGMLAAFMVTSMAACSANKGTEENTVNTETEEEQAILIRVNTEGVGNVAMANEGEEIVWDENYPATSIAEKVLPGTTHTYAAKAGEGYKFVKWMKNGADYAVEDTITAADTDNTEYIAVFIYDNGWTGESVTDINDAQVIGDVLGLPIHGSGYTDSVYTIGVELNGHVYKIKADLTPDVSQALFSLDFDDPEHDQKENELLKDLVITEITDMTENKPAAADLARYEGVKGSDLINEGWTCEGYDLEQMFCYMQKGGYAFKVFFLGEINRDQDDMNEAVKDITVLHVEYDGIGDIMAE